MSDQVSYVALAGCERHPASGAEGELTVRGPSGRESTAIRSYVQGMRLERQNYTREEDHRL